MVNFNNDLPAIRKYFAERIAAQAKLAKTVSAIEVGYRLCQAGLVVVNFDTREKHEMDGEWTVALDGPVLELVHWQMAYESNDASPQSFVLLDGKRLDLRANAGDAVIARVFGMTLLEVSLDALGRGSFDALKLREDCVLEVLEFDWMWMWPEKEADFGKKNLVGKLRGSRGQG